jgi:hypothetical protein
MRRAAILTAGLVLSTGLLAGCGSDKGSDSTTPTSSGSGSYCDQLKAAKADVSSLTSENGDPDFSKFDQIVAKMKQLQAVAPSDVADDWKTIGDTLDKLTKALDDAGIKLDDLMTAVSTGKLPPGVDQTKLVALASQLQSLSSADLTAAGDAITKNAKEQCGLDLSATPTPNN